MSIEQLVKLAEQMDPISEREMRTAKNVATLGRLAPIPILGKSDAITALGAPEGRRMDTVLGANEGARLGMLPGAAIGATGGVLLGLPFKNRIAKGAKKLRNMLDGVDIGELNRRIKAYDDFTIPEGLSEDAFEEALDNQGDLRAAAELATEKLNRVKRDDQIIDAAAPYLGMAAGGMVGIPAGATVGGAIGARAGIENRLREKRPNAPMSKEAMIELYAPETRYIPAKYQNVLTKEAFLGSLGKMMTTAAGKNIGGLARQGVVRGGNVIGGNLGQKALYYGNRAMGYTGKKLQQAGKFVANQGTRLGNYGKNVAVNNVGNMKHNVGVGLKRLGGVMQGAVN